MTEKEEIKPDTVETGARPKEKSEKRQRPRKKSPGSLPPRRVIVRRLPPSMTEEQFLEQVAPLPDHEDFYFAPPDYSLGTMASTRAYLTFKDEEDIFTFRDKYDGFGFLDSKGVEYPAIVEFAPFQGFAGRGKGVKNKPDPKMGTIETEPQYLAFLDKLKEESESTSKEGKLEYTFKLKEEAEITTTPLLEFLDTKKAEKLEEKKRKIDEKKKRRDEERQKKKQQIAKAIPEAINEEKTTNPEKAEKPTERHLAEVDEDGIMVRVVPSRFDRNQRNQKFKDDKKDAKKEKEQERNRQRKEKRQERREKEKAERKVTPKPDVPKMEPKQDEKQLEVVIVEEKSNEPPASEPKPDVKSQKKSREVKKYSERRKEIRERAEQRRQAEVKEAEDLEMAEKPPKPIVTEESKIESWVYKESTDSEEKSRRIRNKDRPSLQIYQPKVRLAANFKGDDKDIDKKGEKDESRPSKENKKQFKERKWSGDSKSGKGSRSPELQGELNITIEKATEPKVEP